DGASEHFFLGGLFIARSEVEHAVVGRGRRRWGGDGGRDRLSTCGGDFLFFVTGFAVVLALWILHALFSADVLAAEGADFLHSRHGDPFPKRRSETPGN